jgi:hypothetical protein
LASRCRSSKHELRHNVRRPVVAPKEQSHRDIVRTIAGPGVAEVVRVRRSTAASGRSVRQCSCAPTSIQSNAGPGVAEVVRVRRSTAASGRSVRQCSCAPTSIQSKLFEDSAGKSSRLTKSPQAPRCRQERRLPLKGQTPLNPEKFAPTGSRTQDLRCYRGSCNH